MKIRLFNFLTRDEENYCRQNSDYKFEYSRSKTLQSSSQKN